MRGVPHDIILLVAAQIDVPSLCNFLEIILAYGLEYNSDKAGYFSPSLKCYFISDGAATTAVPSSCLQT